MEINNNWSNHFESHDYIGAKAQFDKLVASGQFYHLLLIHSCHQYSNGYWIETEVKDLNFLDDLIEEYDGRAFMRNKKIDEILN